MSDGADWFEEQQLEGESAASFEDKVDKLFDLIDKSKEHEKAKKAVDKEIAELEAEIKATMKNLGKKSHKGRKGSVNIAVSRFPSMPSDPAKKNAFFAYLKKEGKYDELVTVNSQTLRGWYNRELEAHCADKGVEDDPDFKIPGLEPYERETFRKVRSK